MYDAMSEVGSLFPRPHPLREKGSRVWLISADFLVAWAADASLHCDWWLWISAVNSHMTLTELRSDWDSQIPTSGPGCCPYWFLQVGWKFELGTCTQNLQTFYNVSTCLWETEMGSESQWVCHRLIIFRCVYDTCCVVRDCVIMQTSIFTRSQTLLLSRRVHCTCISLIVCSRNPSQVAESVKMVLSLWRAII